MGSKMSAVVDQGDWMDTGPVGLVFPVPGAPLSAQQVEERIRTRPNGSVRSQKMVSPVYRDSAGRMRIEWRVEADGDKLADIVLLIDPIASTVVWLLVGRKVAQRDAVPSSDGEFRVGLPAVGQPPVARNWPMKTEALGTRVIQGVEVEGVRTVQTSEDQPPLTAVHETWRCPKLHLTLVIETSGPNWKQTARLQNVEWRDPDPALFVIPPEYTIQEG
jgi:hypothetical protein